MSPSASPAGCSHPIIHDSVPILPWPNAQLKNCEHFLLFQSAHRPVRIWKMVMKLHKNVSKWERGTSVRRNASKKDSRTGLWQNFSDNFGKNVGSSCNLDFDAFSFWQFWHWGFRVDLRESPFRLCWCHHSTYSICNEVAQMGLSPSPMGHFVR